MKDLDQIVLQEGLLASIKDFQNLKSEGSSSIAGPKQGELSYVKLH